MEEVIPRRLASWLSGHLAKLAISLQLRFSDLQASLGEVMIKLEMNIAVL